MFRYKSYKKTFIIAALVILLCLVCLTGATLALFTNANNGTIGIVATAGSVKVDIVDASNEELSLVSQALAFVTSADQKKVLFEPGATFYTQSFKVQNEGDVPINFNLSVSKDDKINEQDFKDAFEIYIARADSPDLQNAELLTSFKARLEAGESSEAFCLIIRMKETVGNDFQGKIYTGIGVTVYAVQGNVEIKE